MRTFIRHERQVQAERRRRVYAPQFFDPYWFLNGSVIEKMVMVELVRRGIWFEFRPQTNNLGGFVDPTWEADFLLPQYKIWIEINGAYFHTLPGQLKTDAMRLAAIEMAGWRALAWWEWDIRDNLQFLMNSVPEFYMVDRGERPGRTNMGLPFYVGSTKDQLVGLRVALHNRAIPGAVNVRHRSRRMPK